MELHDQAEMSAECVAVIVESILSLQETAASWRTSYCASSATRRSARRATGWWSDQTSASAWTS